MFICSSDTEYLKIDTLKDLLKNVNCSISVNRLNVDRIEKEFNLDNTTKVFLIKNENEEFELKFVDNEFKLV